MRFKNKIALEKNLLIVANLILVLVSTDTSVYIPTLIISKLYHRRYRLLLRTVHQTDWLIGGILPR